MVWWEAWDESDDIDSGFCLLFPITHVVSRFSFQTVNRKTFGVELRLGRVEGNSVEQGFGGLVGAAVGKADLLHSFFVKVRAHDLAGHRMVVGRAVHHAPTPKLRQPPDRVFGLWIVAVALVENH